MAAFDIVMAFVALVSFVAGFYCSHQIKSQKRGYSKSFSGTRKKNRKDYVRIEDKENYEYEPKTEKRTNTSGKNSKFDVLLNYFSEKKSEKQAWAPPQDNNVFKTTTAAPLYTEAEPVQRASLPESPVVPNMNTTPAPAMPVQKSEEVRKKENSGDEWVPMGFFED